jgi:hypothetical protein
MLKSLGLKNLPDQATMAAITFSDLVVSHESFSHGLLFHELVHVEQYRQLGIPRFSELQNLGDGVSLLAKRPNVRSRRTTERCERDILTVLLPRKSP